MYVVIFPLSIHFWLWGVYAPKCVALGVTSEMYSFCVVLWDGGWGIQNFKILGHGTERELNIVKAFSSLVMFFEPFRSLTFFSYNHLI